jgi:CIC family chloride channel protein
MGRVFKTLNAALKDLGLTLLIGLLVGLIVSIVANGFVIGVEFFFGIASGLNLFPITIYGETYSLTPLILLPALGVLVVLTRHYFGIDRFQGPADSIYAAHRTDNELNIKSGLGSTLVAFLSASGGASVGQYGPIVHFGATMGSYLKRWSAGTAGTDVFIGCGVAAAISAAFNAPLAGVIFALEAILRHFSLRAVAPIAVSSIAADAFGQGIFGERVFFSREVIDIDLLTMLPPIIMSGPVFGLVAVAFMVALTRSTNFANRSGLPPAALLGIAALGCGAVGVFYPQILGLGTATVDAVLSGEAVNANLFVLLVLKLLVTALCIGFGFFGGVFSPAIFLGATAGGALAVVFSTLSGVFGYSPIELSILATVLATCGMAAVAGPVIGAPLAVVIIILELTMSYEISVIALITVVMSGMVANILYGTSFFDRQLLDRGIDIVRGRGHLKMMETPISHFWQQDYVKLGPTKQVKSAIINMKKMGHTEAYVVAKDHHYIGKVNIMDLLEAKPDDALSNYVDHNALSIKADASLLQCIEAASSFVGESIPIVDRDTLELKGVVTEGDLFTAYLELQNTITDIEKK